MPRARGSRRRRCDPGAGRPPPRTSSSRRASSAMARTMARTIVVGYDATGPAERALARAAELAEALGAQLVVVSVGPLLPLGAASSGTDPMLVPIPPLTVEPGAIPEGREAAERDLERARAALAGRSLQVDYVATAGAP